MNLPVPVQEQAIDTVEITFDQVVSMVEKTVATTSQRVYGQTFRAWQAWCDQYELNYFAITPGNVHQFLADGDTTRATRNRQLSALRKFAQMLTILDGDEARRLYEGLKVLKAPKPDAVKAANKERNKRALSPAEADKVLRTWQDEDTPIGIRNNAMMRLLFFTGLRRSELAELRWAQVDLDRSILYVAHGKGDKPRDVAILDNTSGTIDALELWHDVQGDDRDFIFCRVRKAGKLGPDQPMNDRSVWAVVKQTAKMSGVADFATHDLRRTHLTEYLATGGTLASAQAQAGHADGSTTLKYAQAVDAEKRHEEARFRFGS